MITWILFLVFKWWWVIIISIITIWLGTILVQRTGEVQALPRQQTKPHILIRSIRNHPWVTACIIVFLPLWLIVVQWGVQKWFSGMVYATVGTTETVSTVHPLPPLKSVGGPLRWSDNAKVQNRNRVNREKLDQNGVCFAGIIPPGSFVQATYVAYTPNRTHWDAFLVDFTSSQSFLPPEALGQHATTREGVPVGILSMPQLTSQGRYENRFSNETGMRNGDGPQILECYIQTTGQGPDAMMIEHKEPSGTFQYLVDVGGDAVSVTLPESFKWFWIAPVHHKCYQSHFLGEPVHTTGISSEEAQRITATYPNAMVRDRISSIITTGIIEEYGYCEDHEFQAILIERNGNASTLCEAVLLQQSEMQSGTLNVRLNLPNDKNLSGYVQPAKIIVGIQL